MLEYPGIYIPVYLYVWDLDPTYCFTRLTASRWEIKKVVAYSQAQLASKWDGSYSAILHFRMTIVANHFYLLV